MATVRDRELPRTGRAEPPRGEVSVCVRPSRICAPLTRSIGDKLNLIEPGKNYGWPTVSYGKNYDDTPIPSPAGRREFQEPALYWNPIIAPAGLAFYSGNLFPQWRNSAFVGGLASTALIRIAFDKASPREAERWDMGDRIRAVMTGLDGALWLLEDGTGGRLLRLTPTRRD